MASISGSEPVFGTNALAPARAARTTHSGPSCADTTTMIESGTAARIGRAAFSPLSRPSWMSSTTMSGRSRVAASTAVAVSSAVPTLSKSASASSASASIWANVRWSSTINTRVVRSTRRPFSLLGIQAPL